MVEAEAGQGRDSGNMAGVAAATAVGVLSMTILGVLPMLLAALVDAGRLTLAEIGTGIAADVLVMGVVSIVIGTMLKPLGLRRIALINIAALALIYLALAHASGSGALLLCALAGVPQGFLMWIGMGGIVTQTALPARWMGILVIALNLCQFLLSVALGSYLLPGYGVGGAFLWIAALHLPVLAAIWFLPNQYVVPEQQEDDVERLAPTASGWVALLSAVLVLGARGSIFAYLIPLAQMSGMSLDAARLALSALFAGQILGALLSTFWASRFAYLPVLATGALVAVTCGVILAVSSVAWFFIGATLVIGVTTSFKDIFFVPLLIDVDPSRRSAVQMGSASLFGGSLGPFLAAQAIGGGHLHNALFVAGAMLLAGMIIVIALCCTRPGMLRSATRRPKPDQILAASPH